MRKTLFLMALGVTLVGVALSQTPPETPSPLRLLFPANKTYVTTPKLQVVGLVTTEEPVERVILRVSGPASQQEITAPVVSGGFSANVPLQPGMNEIAASLAQGGEVLVQIAVFRQTPENAKQVPSDFKEYYLHPALQVKQACQDCHRVDGTPESYRQMNITGATCQTSECHADIGEKKYVHGPTAGGTCIACHNPHGSTNPAHVSRSGSNLCLVCHEDIDTLLQENEEVHGVIEMSGCTDCHDPHESPNEFLLLDSPSRELCFTCHDDSKANAAYVHGPVSTGDCVVCHNPHASPNKYLLEAAGNNLCFLCHDAVAEDVQQAEKHPPAEESCLNCHDPHGSDQAKLLNQAQKTLCLDCHDDVKSELQTVTVEHPPVAEGKCADCHSPHGSDQTKLLAFPMPDLCFECHKKLGKFVKESKYRHGPVQEGDCVACHKPHGSTNPKILVKYFPPQFYSPYAEEKYALCFECHNNEIALDEYTTTLTNFRNGDRNLHYVHVNKAKKGRSCKACHGVHASNQPLHIRKEVPYGKMWSYPIKYTQTENGGKCVVGCHKPKEYNRLNPVQYD